MKNDVYYIFLILLLIHSAQTNKIDDGSFFKSQLKQFQSSRIGSAILKMAELNLKLQGPVDELIVTIKQFGQQMQDRMDEENLDFASITADMEKKKIKFEFVINQAEVEVKKEKKRIYSDQIPRKEELDRTLNNLQDQKAENLNQVTMQKALRKQQNELFLTSQSDQGGAIQGIDDSLKILEDQFPKGEILAQISVDPEYKKNISKKLRAIKGSLEQSSLKQFSSFTQSLTSLIGDKQNFENRRFLKSINELLNNLRNSIVTSMNKLIGDESANQLQYQERVTLLQSDLAVFEDKYANYFAERDQISVTLRDSDEIISGYLPDIELYQKRIDLEVQNYAMVQKIHDELLQTLELEMDVIDKATKFLKGPQIMEYLHKQIEVSLQI